MYADALRLYVNTWPHGTVLFEVTDGLHFEAQCAAHGVPDLVLLDLGLPGRDGWATLEWLAEQHPAVRALAYTYEPTDDAVHRALVAGARGVLDRRATGATWLEALEHVRLTGWYTNELSRRQLTHTPDPGSPAALRRKAEKQLSPRELRFLRYYVAPEEYSLRDIARKMGIEPNTAETYRKRVVEKCGEHTRSGLLRFALRFGLTELW